MSRTWVKTCLILLIVTFITAGCYAHWPIHKIPENTKVDLVLVEKSKRRLTLFHDSKEIATYYVSLGRSPIGAKTQEGDNKTPEGLYTIDRHKPDSAYHLALHVSYPEKKDLIHSDPGGDIMIHGIRNGAGFIGRFHLLLDWTRGCIAVTNSEIEQIYALVADGTPLEIKP